MMTWMDAGCGQAMEGGGPRQAGRRPHAFLRQPARRRAAAAVRGGRANDAGLPQGGGPDQRRGAERHVRRVAVAAHSQSQVRQAGPGGHPSGESLQTQAI